jgi:hypothetical protein
MSRHVDHTFIGPFEPLIDYDHGVEKGLWKPAGLAICAEAGVAVDLARRPAFTAQTLQAHHARGVPASNMAAIKVDAMNAFYEGKRGEGLRHVMRYLRKHPLSLELYSIALFGLAGPGAIDWLHHQHLRLTLWRIRRRVVRARRTANEQSPCAE